MTSTNESVIRPSSMLQQKIEKPGNPLSNEILDIFIQSQFGTLTHANLHKKLTEIYDKVSIDFHNSFAFIVQRIVN